jgi:hypothetical protein
MSPEFRAIESQPDPECPCCECGKESDAHGELEDGSFLCIDCEIKDLQNYVDDIEGLMAQDQQSMDAHEASWRATKAQITHLVIVKAGKAQGQIQNPAKDKDNPFFKSKYADLPAYHFWYQRDYGVSELGE